MTWEHEVFKVWPKADPSKPSWAVEFDLMPSWMVDREACKVIARLVDWADLPTVSQRDHNIFERWALGATLAKAGAPLCAEHTRTIVAKVRRIIRGRIVRARKAQIRTLMGQK
jgi:hypothetical protein